MSDPLEQQFQQAAADAQKLTERPSNEVLLRLYALFKQATEGDVQGERPGLGDFRARFKHDAWASIQGMPAQEAMQAYVDLVESLK